MLEIFEREKQKYFAGQRRGNYMRKKKKEKIHVLCPSRRK